MGLDNFAPVTKISIRDRVGQALRAAIIAGEMTPGVVYSAPSLGARFGASATPVREAMLDLVRENLVEIVPNKGFRVTEVSEQDLDEITRLRLLLEPPTVREMTPLIPEEDFAGLRTAAEEIVRSAREGDIVGFTRADQAFHLQLISYAKNRRLSALVAELRSHTRLFGLAEMRDRGDLIPLGLEHFEIVDTIRSRDAEAAERLMYRHINSTRDQWGVRP